MTSHNNKLPKKREKYRAAGQAMSSDNSISKELLTDLEAKLPDSIATSLNELGVLAIGHKPPKYLREIQNRRNQSPTILNMDNRFVLNVSGSERKQALRHRAFYIPLVRHHPYINSANKRDERPRTRSENNDDVMAGPSTSHHQLVAGHDDYNVEELSEIGLKKSKSLENMLAELGFKFGEADQHPELEIVSDCIEKLKMD